MKKLFFANLSAVVALGIFSQIVQIVFLREFLMVFHGNELSLGIILAAWMLWVGTGSRVASILAGKAIRSLAAVSINSAAAAILSVLSIFIIRTLRGSISIAPGAYFSVMDMTLACIVVMAPVGLALGIQFVILSKIWRESDRTGDTSGAEKTYMAEAFGNLVGGILFSFWFVQVFNSFQTVIFSAIVMVAATLWLASGSKNQLSGLAAAIKLSIFGLLSLFILSTPFLRHLDRWVHELQWKFFSPEHHLVEIRQSKYGTISVAQRDNQYSFFQSGNLIFSTAGPDSKAPAFEEQESVVFAHFAMVQHPNPERVLLIGGGLRGTIREIAGHPVQHIDYVELDPVLTDTALPYLPKSTIAALESPRVNLIHTDGRLFIKTTDRAYDIIIADIPDPFTAVLNRYYTEEFFHEVRSRLKPGGIFVTSVISTPDMRGEAVANRNTTLYHTLKRVFPVVFPAGQRSLYFFASSQPDRISADASILVDRFNRRNIQIDGFSSHHFELLLEQSHLRRINWIIRNHGRHPDAHLESPNIGPLFPESIERQNATEPDLLPVNERFFINSDFKPIGYYYTLRFWDALSRAGSADSFKWIIKVKPWWILPSVAFCLGVVLFLKHMALLKRNRTDRRFAVLMAVFSTGLSTMSLQIALLFSFQSLYGFVYEMIGLITALFMGGLALGTFISRKLVKEKSNRTILAMIQLSIALFALIVAFGLPGSAALKSPCVVLVLIAVMTFLSGVFNGADFPLTAASYQTLTGNPEKATGIVYGIELFGACTGAIVSSVVIAPVLGITALGLLAAIANFTAFLCLIISGNQSG